MACANRSQILADSHPITCSLPTSPQPPKPQGKRGLVLQENGLALRDPIMHGSPAPATPAQALQVMTMLEWAMQSALERREITGTAVAG